MIFFLPEFITSLLRYKRRLVFVPCFTPHFEHEISMPLCHAFAQHLAVKTVFYGYSEGLYYRWS
jgi:hypothetical protein